MADNGHHSRSASTSSRRRRRIRTGSEADAHAHAHAPAGDGRSRAPVHVLMPVAVLCVRTLTTPGVRSDQHRGPGTDAQGSTWCPNPWMGLVRRHAMLPRPRRLITRVSLNPAMSRAPVCGSRVKFCSGKKSTSKDFDDTASGLPETVQRETAATSDLDPLDAEEMGDRHRPHSTHGPSAPRGPECGGGAGGCCMKGQHIWLPPSKDCRRAQGGSRGYEGYLGWSPGY